MGKASRVKTKYTGPNLNIQDRQAKLERAKKRRRMFGIIVIAIMVAVLLLLGIMYALEMVIKKITAPTDDDEHPPSYNFCNPKYNEDITQDTYYMGLNRYMTYVNDAERFVITNGKYSDYSPQVAFFSDYFDAAVKGDAGRLNAMYSDNFYRNHKDEYVRDHKELFMRIAPQKIYGLEIELMGQTETGELDPADRTVRSVFYVSYMIYRNDGTFRNDLPPNADGDGGAVRVQEMLLTTYKGVTKIETVRIVKRTW